jgi:hypothetical protein
MFGLGGGAVVVVLGEAVITKIASELFDIRDLSSRARLGRKLWVLSRLKLCLGLCL